MAKETRVKGNRTNFKKKEGTTGKGQKGVVILYELEKKKRRKR